MGTTESKESSSTDVFSEEPFRKIKGWDKSARDVLKAEITGCRPNANHNVNSFNIVLMGDQGSGKSSFLNSIYSIFRERVQNLVLANNSSAVVTREFRMYQLGNEIPIKIGDTKGICTLTSDADVKNLLSIVDGHVPDGQEFNHNNEFCSDSLGYIANPTIADRAHCVGIVIDAVTVYSLNMIMLRDLTSGLLDRKVPFIVLLTHLDDFVNIDITKTFHSIPVKKLMQKITRSLHGLQTNQICPVINYHAEVELEDAKDVLLLYALRTMVFAAQGHLQATANFQKQPESDSRLNYSHQEQGSTYPLKNEKMPMEVEWE